MKRNRAFRRGASFVIISLLFLGAAAGNGTAQENWYPSKWGAGDQLGAGNLLNNETVLKAAKLITEGKIYELGRTYKTGMKAFGSRHFTLVIPQTFGPVGKNNLTWHEDLITAELGQVGTQFDALGHVGIGDKYYNGFDRRDFAKPYGLECLGVERAPVFFTRGVLVDVAGALGVENLELGYEITMADFEKALRMARVEIQKGDVVLVNTGWGRFFGVDDEKYNSGQPGIGVEVAEYLLKKEVVMVGSDNFSVECSPNPNPDLAFPVHQLLLVKNGVYLIEILQLSELAADRVYEFCFSYAPTRFIGATGSPGNPVAIR